MTTAFFDQISHTDFLRLTLTAFEKQGFRVERSTVTDADAVLVGKNNARICVLCKKYRNALISRPILQQFHGAMQQLRCDEGYLISTTDCSPEARDFTTEKNITLYNKERTTELLKSAFGEELFRTAKLPSLGTTAGSATPAARPTVAHASYQKAPSPASQTAPAAAAPGPTRIQEQVRPASEQTAPPVQPPAAETAEQQPAEAQTEQGVDAMGTPAPAPSEKMTTIVCWECNRKLDVPYDQGVIMVTCPECGMKRVYQPPLNSDGELQTTTVISCKKCKQNLNVPINRGQLKVKCPNCSNSWVFTP